MNDRNKLTNEESCSGITLDGLISELERGFVVFRHVRDPEACLSALKELRWYREVVGHEPASSVVEPEVAPPMKPVEYQSGVSYYVCPHYNYRAMRTTPCEKCPPWTHENRPAEPV